MRDWTAARTAGIATAVALVFCLVVFGPNLGSFGTHVIGGQDTDALKHVWSQWWVWYRFARDLRIPFETALLNFPDGGPFFSMDNGNAFLGAPLRPFLAAGPVYNLNCLVNMGLASVPPTMLAREITGPGPHTLVAGPAYAFCAWVMAFGVNAGVSETIVLFPWPLAVLFGARMLRRRGWGAPVLCGAFLLFQALACWSYAIFAPLLLSFIGLAWLACRPWRAPAGAEWGLAGGLTRIGVSLAVVALAVAPLFLSVEGTVAGDDAVYDRHLSVLPTPDRPPSFYPVFHNFALGEFFTPGEAGFRVDAVSVEVLFYAAWGGLMTWLLFVPGVLFGGWKARAGALFAAVFMGFAAGPYVDLWTFGGGPGTYNALYHLFYNWFPLFNATIHSTDRFAVGFQLCAAVTAAAGLGWLLKRLPERLRLPGALAACGVVLLDVCYLSPAPWPIAQSPSSPHPSALALAGRPEGAVLDLPFFRENDTQFIGDILLQQTVHARPVPFSLDGMGVEVVSPTLRQSRFYRQLESQLMGTPEVGWGCSGLGDLAELGFGYLIWRPTEATEADREKIEPLLARCLGEGEVFEDRVLYEIPR